MSALKLVPAIEENFFKDRCFADQRVAGANPYQLWRVTNKEGKSTWRKKMLRFIHSLSLWQRKIDTVETGIINTYFNRNDGVYICRTNWNRYTKPRSVQIRTFVTTINRVIRRAFWQNSLGTIMAKNYPTNKHLYSSWLPITWIPDKSEPILQLL